MVLNFGKRQLCSHHIAVMEKYRRKDNQNIGKLVYKYQHCASVAELIIYVSSQKSLMAVRKNETKEPAYLDGTVLRCLGWKVCQICQ